jgi:hypothetical protein
MPKKRPPSVTILTQMIKEGWIEKHGVYAWVIFNVLFSFADWNTGGSCYPSYNKMQKLTGLARATISKAIKTLEDIGEIIVQRHNSPLAHKSNSYIVKRICDRK